MPSSSSSSPQEIIVLAERSLSLARSISLSASPEPRTPYAEGTVFSLMWQSERSTFQIYRHAILLMGTGGSFLVCGALLSALYFSGFNDRYANILGPVMVSFGLMVLVIGIVLIPITRDMQLSLFKKMCSLYGSQYQI